MVEGEQLDGIGGLVTVERRRTLPCTHRVYNLTVQGEHLYRVAHSGVLVHNQGCGVIAKNGTRITGYTSHGVDRAIGNNLDRAGTSVKAILEALKSPNKITTGVDELGRPFEVFIGSNARVVVNPKTGRIVSVNPLGRGGVRGR